MSKTYRKNPKTGKIYQDKDRKHGALKFDRTCLSHGSCPYCRNNRLFNWLKKKFCSYKDVQDEIR